MSALNGAKRATNQDWLTIAEASEHLKCSHKTIRRMISRGELRAYRFGRLIRIKAQDLDRAFKPVTNLADMRGGLNA